MAIDGNWTEVGPKILGKLHIFTGTMDNFYLNNSTRMLEDWLRTTSNPNYPGHFEYGVGAGHCWAGDVTQSERLREIAAYVRERMPEGIAAGWQ
jgi:hypothetical protein